MPSKPGKYSIKYWILAVAALIKKLTDVNRSLTDPANRCLTDD